MGTKEVNKTKRGWKFFQYYSGDKIPGPTKWIYSAASIFRDASYSLVSAFMLNFLMYSGVLGTGGADYLQEISVITIILVIDLIWDGLNDPIMGLIVEKCHFKHGKYRPWILIGGIGNTIVILCLFLIRPTGWAYVITWGIFYFLWDFVFTMNDIAYWAMLPSLTSDEKQRANITTVLSIFVSIGTFAMYAVCSLLPSTFGYQFTYTIIAIVAASLFLASQIAVYLFCQEHERDPKQEAISEKTKFSDMFKMLKINKPLRISVIAMLVYYTGSTIVVGFGINYFYLAYGYGGVDAGNNVLAGGGTIMTIFTVMYVLGTLMAQFLFPLIKKHFKDQTIMTWSAIIAILGYVMMFIVGFPLFGEHPLAWNSAIGVNGFATMADCLGGMMFLLYIPPFIFFAAEGVFYLVLLLMMQNSIEYNEWKFGERKESVAFSWRPLDAKFASAIQKFVVFVTLLGAGLYGITNSISDVENQKAGGLTSPIDATTQISGYISSINQWQLIVLGIGMIGSAVLSILASYLLVHFGYTIDEKTYRQITEDLKKRHLADKKEEEALKEAKA